MRYVTLICLKISRFSIISSAVLLSGRRISCRMRITPAYQSEYGYFDRNDTLNKTLYVCGGEQEDADYEEYYGENDSTIEGISHFMQRLEEHSVTTAECKIYDGSNHYEYIPDMFREFFLKFYGKS